MTKTTDRQMLIDLAKRIFDKKLALTPGSFIEMGKGIRFYYSGDAYFSFKMEGLDMTATCRGLSISGRVQNVSDINVKQFVEKFEKGIDEKYTKKLGKQKEMEIKNLEKKLKDLKTK